MRDVEPLSDGEWTDEVITAFQDNIDFDFSAICPNKSQVETAYAGNSYEITLTYIDEAHGKDKDLAIEYHNLGLWKYSNKILNPEDFEMPEFENYDEKGKSTYISCRNVGTTMFMNVFIFCRRV